jgi:hypothetical protein
MGKEVMPAFVAMQGCQCQEGFVAFETPELAGEFETALESGTGALDGA